MTVRSTASNQSRFEILESRRLLAVISVATFGAIGSDGADDSYQIQRAIDSAAPGDTIDFPAGVYNVGRTVDPRGGGRILKGEPGAIIQSGNHPALHLTGNDLTVTGLTFQGKGIFIDKPAGGMNSGVNIDNNVFQLDGIGGQDAAGVYFTCGLNNTKITNNLFTGYGGFGIFGYNYKGLTIANNEFVNVSAGAHIDAQGNNNQYNGDLVVSQNYITGAKGMGLEFQGAASNLQFIDNWYEHPNLQGGSSRNPANDNSFGYSLILDKSTDIYIARNTVIAPERPDTVGCRVGFELGGDNAIAEDNYIDGVSITAADNDGVGSGSVIFRNNKVSNYQYGDYQAFPASNRTYQSYNNGPDVQLTWDTNRGKPGRNGHLSGPTNPPPVTPPPGTGSTWGPSALVATPVGSNSVDLSWKDNSTNEIGFRIERSFDGQNWMQIAESAANTPHYINAGLPAGLQVYYRVLAYTSTAFSLPSNVVSVTTGDPSTATAPHSPTTDYGTPNGSTNPVVAPTAPRTPSRTRPPTSSQVTI